jgi:hypothetical protein
LAIEFSTHKPSPGIGIIYNNKKNTRLVLLLGPPVIFAGMKQTTYSLRTTSLFLFFLILADIFPKCEIIFKKKKGEFRGFQSSEVSKNFKN